MINGFWNDKKILVTGAHGFLGKHVIENLLNKKKVSRSNLSLPKSNVLDLRKWENCQKAVEGIDLVIHLAANVGGIGYNIQNPGSIFYDNAVMGIQIIEAARQSSVQKLVIIGSVCAYPKYAPIPFKEEALWNGFPEESNAPYGIAKRMLLVQSQAYRKQYDFNSIYLLPVNLYGPGDNFHPEYSHVIPALIQKFDSALDNGLAEVTLWGTGTVTREFLYVEDAVEGIILATENYDDSSPINLGSGQEIKISQLAYLIAEQIGYQGSILFDKTRPDGQPRRRLDVEKAKKEFNFKSKTSLKEGLRKTLDWFYDVKKV